MSAAISSTKLNSGHRFGRLACALALLPMLLWPSLARAECCCPVLVSQSQVKLTQTELVSNTLSAPGKSVASVGRRPLEQETNASCPHCSANPKPTIADSLPDLASLSSHCDCQTRLLASFISPRAEISSTDPRTISFPRTVGFPNGSTASSAEVDRPLLAMSGNIPVRLVAPTANQRRAFLCCWLN